MPTKYAKKVRKTAAKAVRRKPTTRKRKATKRRKR